MMKIVEIFLEVLGWLLIAVGTALGAGLIGFIIYSQSKSQTAKIGHITEK